MLKIVTRVEHIKTSRTNSKTKFFFLDSATWLILDCTWQSKTSIGNYSKYHLDLLHLMNCHEGGIEAPIKLKISVGVFPLVSENTCVPFIYALKSFCLYLKAILLRWSKVYDIEKTLSSGQICVAAN